jgi:TonB family protein
MRTKTPIVIAAVVCVLLLAPRVQAQESLENARQLYASAEYDSALTMLNGLMTSSSTREERRTVALYRTLCLLATNRRAEADRAIETLVSQDPLFRPNVEEIPPRMRTAIADTRKRLLPAILQQKYAESKAAYDQKDFAVASVGFKEMLEGLSDPDIAAAASQSPLADLKTLAVGFYELSVKSLPPPVPPPTKVAEAPVPTPSVAQAPKLYSVEDRNVVPPIAVKQQIPAFPGRVSAAKTGVLELVIDNTGAVESATMRVSVNPQYDRLATSAARTWQFQPATIDGSPVKFLKRIQVSLVPTP